MPLELGRSKVVPFLQLAVIRLTFRPRVTYATTKYCTSFLKKQQCRTPGCIYLHRQGEDPDVVLKEELRYACWANMGLQVITFCSPQLKEKTRKLLSPLFPIVDANESSRVSPGGR